jgi:hypothetical protein
MIGVLLYKDCLANRTTSLEFVISLYSPIAPMIPMSSASRPPFGAEYPFGAEI